VDIERFRGRKRYILDLGIQGILGDYERFLWIREGYQVMFLLISRSRG